jgi:hypothetical protein
VPALHQMLGWQESRFASLKNVAPVERTIFLDVQNLPDGLRRLDEQRVMAERLPTRDTVLHLAREEGPELATESLQRSRAQRHSPQEALPCG